MVSSIVAVVGRRGEEEGSDDVGEITVNGEIVPFENVSRNGGQGGSKVVVRLDVAWLRG